MPRTFLKMVLAETTHVDSDMGDGLDVVRQVDSTGVSVLCISHEHQDKII